jgi:dTDP-4-amino-4,6-dideoxygalactose transaminase
VDRVELRDRLAADKIFIDWAYDPPLHLQPVYRNLLGTEPGMLPRSEEILSRQICLPVHAQMRDEDAAFVVDRLLHHVSILARPAGQAT